MRLAQVQPDKCTLRQHLQAAVANGAKPHPDLLAEPPEGGESLVELFYELGATRSAGLAGANPLLPSEIESWCRLQQLALTPWEVDTLLAMDRAANAVRPAAERGH